MCILWFRETKLAVTLQSHFRREHKRASPDHKSINFCLCKDVEKTIWCEILSIQCSPRHKSGPYRGILILGGKKNRCTIIVLQIFLVIVIRFFFHRIFVITLWTPCIIFQGNQMSASENASFLCFSLYKTGIFVTVQCYFQLTFPPAFLIFIIIWIVTLQEYSDFK